MRERKNGEAVKDANQRSSAFQSAVTNNISM